MQETVNCLYLSLLVVRVLKYYFISANFWNIYLPTRGRIFREGWFSHIIMGYILSRYVGFPDSSIDM
jgi:hypothetical protein